MVLCNSNIPFRKFIVLMFTSLAFSTHAGSSDNCTSFWFSNGSSDIRVRGTELSVINLPFALQPSGCFIRANQAYFVYVSQPPKHGTDRHGYCVIRLKNNTCKSFNDPSCRCDKRDGSISFVFTKTLSMEDNGYWLWHTADGSLETEVQFDVYIGTVTDDSIPQTTTEYVASTPQQVTKSPVTSPKPILFQLIEVRQTPFNITSDKGDQNKAVFQAECFSSGVIFCLAPSTNTSIISELVVLRHPSEATDVPITNNSTDARTSTMVDTHAETSAATCYWEKRRTTSARPDTRLEQVSAAGDFKMQQVLSSDCEGLEKITCFDPNRTNNNTIDLIVSCDIKNLVIQYNKQPPVNEDSDNMLFLVTVTLPLAAVVVVICMVLLIVRLKQSNSVDLHVESTGTPESLPPPPAPHNVRRRPLDTVIFRSAQPVVEQDRDSFGSVHTHLYSDIDDPQIFAHTSVNTQVSSDSHDVDKPVARILTGIISRPSDSSSSEEYAVAYGCRVVGTTMPAQNHSPASSSDSDGYLKPSTSCSEAQPVQRTRTRTSAKPQRTFAPVTSAKRGMSFGKSSDYLNPVACLSKDVTVWTTSDTSLEAATATPSDRESTTFPRVTSITSHIASGTSTKPWLRSTQNNIAQRGTVASAITDIRETSHDSETVVAMTTASSSTLTLSGTLIAALKAAAVAESQAADQKKPDVSVKTMYTGERDTPSCVTCRSGGPSKM